MNTLTFKRATKAAEFIDDIKGAQNAGEIRAELDALPAMIQTSGLLQTLVYLLEIGKGDRKKLGEHLQAHLNATSGLPPNAKPTLLCNADNLGAATEEALAYAQWLKLLAKATIEKKGSIRPPEGNTNTSTPAASKGGTHP
jgi:CRISPR type III-B/RAMP module-associated protein Cmr5